MKQSRTGLQKSTIPGKMPELNVFDLETTGVDPSTARIVEVGIVMRGVSGTMTYGTRVNPGIPIPEDASKVHGIRASHVADSPEFCDIASEITACLLGGSGVIAGFNASAYDMPLLLAELNRWKFPEQSFTAVLDPLVFIRWHHRDRRFRKLEEVCDWLGVDTGISHCALDDAAATLQVIDKLIDRGTIPQSMPNALKDQAMIQPLLAQEFEDFGYWLYRDRVTGDHRIGAGKHCGSFLSEVPASYLGWVLQNCDIPHLAVEAIKARL